MRGFIAALLVGVTGLPGGRVRRQEQRRRRHDDRRRDRDHRGRHDLDGDRHHSTTDTTETDTTATDTTSTDTTSTDTTATDTTTTAAGLTAGCQKVADLSVQFGKALSAAGANGSTDVEKTAKAYEAFAQQVPAEIRDAFETLAKAYAQYAVAIKGIHFEAGQVPDASTIAKLTKAAQSLNGQDLTKANADISVWVTKNCSATR